MKKFVKVVLIAAGVFCILGVGLSVAGAAMGARVDKTDVLKRLRERGWDLDDIDDLIWDYDDDDWDDYDDDWDDDDWYDDDHYEAHHEAAVQPAPAETGDDVRRCELGDVWELEIELYSEELIFQTHDQDQIVVEIRNDPDESVRVRSKTDGAEITGRYSTQDTDRKVYVLYPENMDFDELDIKMETGAVKVEDPVSARKFSVEIGTGSFEGKAAVAARKTEIDVNTGSVEFDDLSSDEIEGECRVGTMKMTLAGKQSDYNYKLECGAGSIEYGDISRSNVGNVKERLEGAVRSVELECGVGRIEVDFSED